VVRINILKCPYRLYFQRFILICCCGVHMIDAELLEMIERADTDTDGEISPDEFYAIMTKKTFT
jgi:Ca2+-binding EF-hand superfamily protein